MKKDFGLLVLRVGVGGMMFVFHGWNKIVHFSTLYKTFPNPIGIGSSISLSVVVFAEFFCTVAVVFGFFTRWAVIPLIVELAVAVFVVQSHLSWIQRELALLYVIPFVTLLLTGSGHFSLDSFIKRK